MKTQFISAALLGTALWLQPSHVEARFTDDSNLTCPVMLDEPSDPGIFVEHEGQKVYLCCTKCKREWKKDPAKYLARLNELKAAQKKDAKKPAAKDVSTTGSR